MTIGYNYLKGGLLSGICQGVGLLSDEVLKSSAVDHTASNTPDPIRTP
jgi:hypothetical protein